MRLLRPSKLAAIAVMFLAAPFCLAQSPAPTRPRITGISHVGYFVYDLPKETLHKFCDHSLIA
jgi:hypothetical protein